VRSHTWIWVELQGVGGVGANVVKKQGLDMIFFLCMYCLLRPDFWKEEGLVSFSGAVYTPLNPP
jgi:hypothetical protein